MDEYPSNSKKYKDRDEDEQKKIPRIVSGEVVRRKRSVGKRVKDFFVGVDAKSIRNHVWFEILVPAAKDTLVDAVREAVERRVFGESRYGSSRRRSSRSSSNTSEYVNYGNRYTQNNTSRHNQRDEPRSMSSRARSSHNFDEVILKTRAEANEVLDNIFQIIEKYDVASVADLYMMLNIKGEYTDRNWGWVDISGADVSQVREGYLLNLPKPEPID